MQPQELAAEAAKPHGRSVDDQAYCGHAESMKTAVSIPDKVFEEAERLVTELRTSRGQLYSRALKEFVDLHAPARVAEAMNRVVDQVGGEVDEISREAAPFPAHRGIYADHHPEDLEYTLS